MKIKSIYDSYKKSKLYVIYLKLLSSWNKTNSIQEKEESLILEKGLSI